MEATDSQVLYVALVLPTLFGLTLVAEGLNKIIKKENQGLIAIITGFAFIVLVFFAYFFFL